MSFLTFILMVIPFNERGNIKSSIITDLPLHHCLSRTEMLWVHLSAWCQYLPLSGSGLGWREMIPIHTIEQDIRLTVSWLNWSCVCACVMGECLGWRQLAYISLTSKCLTVKRCMLARTHSLAHLILHHIKIILLHLRIKFYQKNPTTFGWSIQHIYSSEVTTVFDFITQLMFILQFKTTLVINVIIDVLMWWDSTL